MAQGTLTVFNEAKQNLSGLLDLSSATDFSCMLITTLPTAEDLTPDSADYTEVTGTGYTAGGIALATTWDESAGTVTFDSSVNPSWAQNGAGPTNVVAALIYSETAVGEDALAFVDLTVDGGTTALSMQSGSITVNFNAAGLFDLA